MVADTQIKHAAELYRQTRSGQELKLVGSQDYSFLDETDPDKQTYINGGGPDGKGRTIRAVSTLIEQGEYLVYKARNRNGANVTLDSDFATGTSGKLLIEILVEDAATGDVYPRQLTEADRDTDLFADDPTLPNGKWAKAYAFEVPTGETWELFGLFQADLRTLT